MLDPAQGLQTPIGLWYVGSGTAKGTGDFVAGEMINEQYRVLGVLGRGSNGVTYKAKHSS